MAAVLSGSLYVCGGKVDNTRYSAAVERFDPWGRAWLAQPAMPRPCSHGAAAVVAGRLHICGGFDGVQYMAAAVRFCPGATAWDTLPPMSERRSHPVAASVGGRLVVCGGKGEGTLRLDSVERLDPEGAGWEPLPPMLERRSQAASAVVRGALHVCGGFDGVQHLRSVEYLSRGVWRMSLPMAVPRSSAAAAAVAGRLYVCGGFDGAQHLQSAEVLQVGGTAAADPAGERGLRSLAGRGGWQPMPPMLVARSHATAAAMWSLPASPADPYM
jgi:N-acetylneuraminic acid mutarotase